MTINVLSNARVYGCACKQDRTDKLLTRIRNLGIADWKIAQERPGNPNEYGKVVLDPPSRRFRHQLTVETDRPFMWLEDDADIPKNFSELWQPYNHSLPHNWKIAVIGWGLLLEDDAVRWKPVNEFWCQTYDGHPQWGAFHGLQCAIVNAGEWRLELAKGKFRCDSGLANAMRDIGIEDDLYLSRTILVGTDDHLTTFGANVITYPKLTKPRLFSHNQHAQTGNGYSPIEGM